MQRRKVAVILALLIATSAIMTAVATTGSTLTWEKTFEVKKPEITAKIRIGDDRIVGYPVKIQVSLRIQVPSHEDQDNHEDDHTQNCNASIYNVKVNGTYAANLLWLNTTDNQWQQLKVLQPETNVTITCRWYTNTYVFTPMQEGQYKVVVTFTTGSETKTFTSGA
jgi:hypothetical protein